MAQHALRALLLLAIDPGRLGGARLLTDRGSGCDAWLSGLRLCLGRDRPWRRLPARCDDEALLGGTDLTASLRAGRPVRREGLLQAAAGGILMAGLAERLEPRSAALIAAALDADTGQRFGLVALDSGRAEGEGCPALLLERLALQVDLRLVEAAELAIDEPEQQRVLRARSLLGAVRVSHEQLTAICTTAQAFGIVSARAASLALAVACANAAYEGRGALEPQDLEWAGRLVLAVRARVLPVPPEATEPPAAPAEDESAATSEPDAQAQPRESDGSIAEPRIAGPRAEEAAERIVEATRAAIPPGLLSTLIAQQQRARSGQVGKAGACVSSGRRGRPIGVRSGLPRHGARLDLLATLRTAAPWQRWRAGRGAGGSANERIRVEAGDCRVRRYRERTQTLTLFVIDASGSNALHRMAECKGAVELWLAECYVRRDQVAVVSFRGRRADLVVPPTRSLVRAKRSLAGLAGGGATPLAHGLDLAGGLALQLRRRGLMPQVVLLTDGHANIARDGSVDRTRAHEDALAIARQLGAHGLRSLVVDTAPRPQPAARALAGALGARYLPLPRADARALLGAVRQAG